MHSPLPLHVPESKEDSNSAVCLPPIDPNLILPSTIQGKVDIGSNSQNSSICNGVSDAYASTVKETENAVPGLSVSDVSTLSDRENPEKIWWD